VVAQHSTEPIAALNSSIRECDIRRLDQPIFDALMISLNVIMDLVFKDGTT
jgi:hypothetical protein